VGGVTSLPLAGTPGRSAFTIEGRPATSGDIPNSEASFVTPGYFRALGVDLVRGRLFDDHDDVHAPLALVVSESFARQFYPGEDAIGKRIGPAREPQRRRPYRRRRSTADDRRHRARREERAARRRRAVALSLGAPDVESEPDAVARTSHDPPISTDPPRSAGGRAGLQRADDGGGVASALGERRFAMLLLVFAATALLLSGIGIYG
jgi:hypothetical protein